MVSILLGVVCGMAVVCVAAVLPSAVVWLVPYSSRCSAGEYCCQSCVVSCQVCGVWVVSVCLWCSCGGVSSVHSPLVVVEGGAIVDGGACCGGGWHGEGRAAVLLTPRRMLVSPPVC